MLFFWIIILSLTNNIIGGEIIKIVLQDGIKDCGICSLLSIIRFYGGEVSKEYLREITNTTKDGVSFYMLIEAAKSLGFDAIGVTGQINDLNVNNLPCIAHFIVNKNYKHFVVIYEIDNKNNSITIMDPAKGKRVLSFSEFNLSTSNNFILLKPLKKLPIIKNKNIVIKSIFSYLKKNKYIYFLLLFLLISAFIFNIVSSFSFKYLLEYSINYNVINNIDNIFICLFIIIIFKNTSNLLCNILLNKWIIIFDQEITNITFKQIILLPYLYFKNRTTGEVISKFRDLNIIKNYISKFIYSFIIDFFSIIIFLFIMYKYQINMFIIIFIFSLIFLLFYIYSVKKKKKLIISLNKNQDIINSYLVEAISNVDTIKGSHLEKRLYDKFSIKYKNMLNVLYKYSLFNSIVDYFKNNNFDILTLIIYSLGSYLVIKNSISLSNIIIYQSFFIYYINSFTRFLNLIGEFNEFIVSLNRVEDLFLLDEESFNHNFYYLAYDLIGDIKFNNLFYKIGSRVLFNNSNIVIKRGEKILISGESGSGKSTLVKILMRYIEVPYGMVSINNIDINHYHLENIRSNICYVTSNEYLFTDSLRNNICLNKEINEEEFLKITNICLVDDLVNNDELGYDKLIEENGFNFSNGERQRIILARSLLKKSNIYIFDEAFGNIDIDREKKILNNIFDYLKDKIVIVISHRFNNKKLFDRVIKIKDGDIIEL